MLGDAMVNDFLQLSKKEHLQQLVDDGTDESLTLDYKASSSLTRDSTESNEMCKDVSALANSAGSRIIYGVEEDRKIHKPMRIDEGVRDPKITRDWIIQILNSRVRPRMEGIAIEEIPLDKGLGFVITVPPTVTFPHQAPDKKYYKRYGTESAPMDDYEIRDIMNRSTVPVLSVGISAFKPTTSKDFQGHSTIVIPFTAYIHNVASTPAIYTTFRLFFDVRLEVVDRSIMHYGDEVSLGQESISALFRNFSPPDDFPIFRENPPDRIEIKVATPVPRYPTNYFLAAHIATPGFDRLYRGSVLVDQKTAHLTWPDQETHV
jgi:hypothetical protein